MSRMQEDRRDLDRALRVSLDWVLTAAAVLTAVLRTPTQLTPNRLLVSRGMHTSLRYF